VASEVRSTSVRSRSPSGCPRGWSGALVALALALAAGCGAGGPLLPGAGEAAPFRGPIVLVTLAGLRADAVGGAPSATPFLDRFLAEATWAGTGVASSSWCAGSLASVLTGLPPALHGAAHPARPWLRADARTVAEELAAAGFATRGFYSTPWLGPGFGLERGFEALRPLRPRSAERWLAQLDGGPSLTWIQLPLPGVSLPPASSAGGGGEAAEGAPAAEPAVAPARRRRARRAHAAQRQDSAALRHESAAVRQNGIAGRPGPTAAELAYRQRVDEADRALGRLLEALRHGGRYQEAIVIVLADHGEGVAGGEPLPPGLDLGRGSVEVPLGILLPPPQAGRLQAPAGSAVGLDRIHATVLELAGLRPLPGAAPSLLRPSGWATLSELWFGNGYHELALHEDGHQLRWRCRFAPPEVGFEAARREALELDGSVRYATMIDRLERAFRSQPRCVEGEDVTLESWPAGGGAAAVEDAARRDRMLERLRRQRAFPPAWSLEAPPAPPALGRRELRALTGWGLPVPWQERGSTPATG
jgi:Sulfatase